MRRMSLGRSTVSHLRPETTRQNTVCNTELWLPTLWSSLQASCKGNYHNERQQGREDPIAVSRVDCGRKLLWQARIKNGCRAEGKTGDDAAEGIDHGRDAVVGS